MKQTNIIIAIVIFVLAAAGVFAYTQLDDNSDTMMNGESKMEDTMDKDEAMMQEDAMENEDSMEDEDEMMEEDAMEDEDSMMEEDKMEDKDSMMEEESMDGEDSMEKTDTQAAAPGEYRDYDADAVAQAATNGDAVLFFHAPWCPTCSALNRNIESNTDNIPDGLTIFKTDYDSQTELKQKYGVTYQHTLVQVDADGNMITKWSGGNTLETITDRVQ